MILHKPGPKRQLGRVPRVNSRTTVGVGREKYVAEPHTGTPLEKSAANIKDASIHRLSSS
jgi:hypothetical protein